MRRLFIIMAFMLNMLCSEASEINFNNINAGDVREFQPIEEEDENGKKYITFNVGDHTIKFPKDGKQPDVNNAVEWSCAKIDNNVDSAITYWYLKMFGIIDRNGEPSTDDAKYIKAGFSREGIDRIIKINMHRQIDDAYQEPEPKDITLQDCRKAMNLYLNARDIKEFKKYVVSKFVQNITSIASNPVGRLLLYRLLIEIRRTQDGVGCLEGNNQDPNTLNYELLESNSNDLRERRNRMRAIIVNFMSAFGFDDDNGVLAFSLYQPELILLNTKDNELIAETCESDVAIVHEMVHWYQRLRHPRRVDAEAQLNSEVGDDFDSSPICKIMDYDKTLKIAGLWKNRGFPVDVCEFRVVFGLPEAPNENLNWCFLNGDELSENLYRISKSIQAKKETQDVRFSYIQNSQELMSTADYALNEITETDRFGTKNNSIIEYASKLYEILDIK